MSRKLGRLTLHGESGWLGRALTSSVAIAVLATARPDENWAWFVLGGGLLVFLAGTVLMTIRPYVALTLLGIVAVSNALIAGPLFGLNRRQYEVQVRQTEQLLEQTRLAQNEPARAATLDERAYRKGIADN